MEQFCEQVRGIWRLRVPFDKIYTSVFLIRTETDAFLVDCATTAQDVDECIIPALSCLGLSLSDVRAIVLTHKHEDHAGGCPRILELAPTVKIVSDVCRLCEGISTYPMAGHTVDCIGVLDERTHTLISGDGLQGAGVDKYRCSIKSREAYFQTLERVKSDERIENLLLSHAYEPWNTDKLVGRKAVCECAEQCKEYVKV